MTFNRLKQFSISRAGLLTGAAAMAAAVTAAWVNARARRAERDHRQLGRFIDVDGVRLHVVERGAGTPVVLLHGNAVSVDDFAVSGLIDCLARQHHVIAFDRPGFGHSLRPRDRLWTPAAQAALLHMALHQLGITEPAVLVGHSMGTMVAMAMALDFPSAVRSLVLLGGYYYPTARLDAVLTAPVALPIVGDALRYTVTALAARAALGGAVKAMFSPNLVPAAFFPALSREMMVRPVQLRANAEDAAFMIPAAHAASQRYAGLQMPVTLIAGAEDKVVDPKAQSVRLHDALIDSDLILVPGAGHMVHHVAARRVVEAVGRGWQSPAAAGALGGGETLAPGEVTAAAQPAGSTVRTAGAESGPHP